MEGEETATPAGFLIDGKEYPIPDVNTFNLDEDELLWDYAGLAREDFVPVDPDEDDSERLEAERRRKLRHPGVMRTLLHVAYQRGNPTVKPVVIKRLIGTVTLSGAMSLIVAEEPDEDPLAQSALTSKPSESSPTGSSVTDDSTKPSPESSGNGTKKGSDEPAGQPEPTGAGR